MKSLQRLIRPRRGQSLVETAVILPVLLTLMFIITDAGFAFFGYVQVINAAREGSRAASRYQYLHNSPTSLSTVYTDSQNDQNRGFGTGGITPVYTDNAQAAAKQAVGRLDPTKLTVEVTYPESARSDNPSRSGQPVAVKVTYPYTLPVTSAFSFWHPTVTLSHTTTTMIRADLDPDH